MTKSTLNELTPQQRAEALADSLTVQEHAEQLKYDAPAIPKAGLPAYNWWNEGLHGVARAGTATMFPQAIGLAAMFDREQLRRCAEITSQEARAKYNAAQAHGDHDIYKGLTLWAPNVNIFRDPRWGRGHETYGEDPYLTARLGVEYVKGLQGDGKYLKTAACAKHFAVHSGPEAERHTFDAVVSQKDLEETYLPAFKALVEEAHVESVMGAYNLVNGEPACASEFLMSKLREWGFDGYFTSDCWAIRDFHTTHCITATAPESAALALKAGCDMNCGNTYLHILAALEKGLVTAEDIRRACVHVLRTRIRLGQLDRTEYDDIPITDVSTEESKAVIRKLLTETEKPMVIDADGLNCIAAMGEEGMRLLDNAKAPLILTPHMLEFSRLSGMSIDEIKADRFAIAWDFATRHNLTLILKDSNTVIASPDGELYMNDNGNSGLSKGGSGDVLAGMVASFLAQGAQPVQAAICGVYLHAAAGDAAERHLTAYGMLPGDVIDHIPEAFGELLWM